MIGRALAFRAMHLPGRIGGALLSVMLACAAPAQADLPRAIVSAFNLTPPESAGSELADIQRDLLWTGHYRGIIDGTAGPGTDAAIRSFQTSLDQVATGTLDAASRATLAKRAAETRQDMDLRVSTSDWTGIRMAVPHGFVSEPRIDPDDPLDMLYEGRAAVPFEIRQLRFDSGGSGFNPRSLAADIVKDKKDAEVLTAGTAEGVGYMQIRIEDLVFYSIMGHEKGETRGVSVVVSSSDSMALLPVMAEVFASTDLFAGDGVPMDDVTRRLSQGRYPGMEDRPDWYRSMKASGSGSLVSTEGHVLTNHHVIASCDRLTVNGQPALLIGSDVRLDLALLKAQRFAGREPVTFRSRGPALGEGILVMGYPVFSLTQAMNVTDGVISSTFGFEGSRLSLQITAPVQPGNSGGPVFDLAGQQLAVVAAKAGKSLRAETGIENMAWVIRAEAVREFLDRYQIRLRTADGAVRPAPTDSIVASQRDKVLRVECH